MTDQTLLDPKNDYVFKRLFGEATELLVALLNDLRPDLPEIRSVEILNQIGKSPGSAGETVKV